MMEAALEPARRALERAVGIALADRESADQVGAEAIVNDRRAGAERRFGIDHGRQRLEIEPDQCAASSAA